MNIQTQITIPLVKHWEVHHCWWRLIQASNNCQLLTKINRSSDNVTEQYTLNLLSTIALYGRHVKIVIYSPQAFIENFLNSCFIIVGLWWKYVYNANYGNNIRRKGNSDTYSTLIILLEDGTLGVQEGDGDNSFSHGTGQRTQSLNGRKKKKTSTGVRHARPWAVAHPLRPHWQHRNLHRRENLTCHKANLKRFWRFWFSKLTL
jgi:hypothetical protein